MAQNVSSGQPTPKSVSILTTDRQMSTVRFSPCGDFLAAAGRDGTIRFWRKPNEEDFNEPPEPEQKKPKKEQPLIYVESAQLTGHNGWVSYLEFHAASEQIISSDTWGKLCAWSYRNGQPQRVWQVEAAHDGWLRQFALSPDGKQIATCGMDQTIRLWSVADGSPQGEIGAGDDTYSLAFHPQDGTLVSGDLFGKVKQWSLKTHAMEREFDASVLHLRSRLQDVGGVRSLSFDASGKVLAAAGGKPSGGGFVQGVPTICFFDWDSGQNTTVELGATTEVYVLELKFHPDGYWLGAVSGQPGKGKFFLLTAGEKEPFFSTNLPNCHSIDLHPDGVRLAVIGNDGTWGQAKSMAREGIYPGNYSPIHIYDLTEAEAAKT